MIHFSACSHEKCFSFKEIKLFQSEEKTIHHVRIFTVCTMHTIPYSRLSETLKMGIIIRLTCTCNIMSNEEQSKEGSILFLQVIEQHL